AWAPPSARPRSATWTTWPRWAPRSLWPCTFAARTPSLEELDRKLVGRMLAAPRAQQPHVRAWLEKFSRSPLFPWQGKTFKHETADHGHGVNRLLGERVTWFRFHTFVGPSDAGDLDAVHLDYSTTATPPWCARSSTRSVRWRPGCPSY